MEHDMAIAFIKKASGAEFQTIYDKAHKAGIRAGTDALPTTMLVAERVNPLDANSQVKRTWVVPEGLYGFAWISFPGNTAWARWCKAQGLDGNDYPRGKLIWVSQFGQSYERKLAYAKAFATVLNENGIRCYSCGRLD